MATLFFISTKEKKGMTTLFVRLQSKVQKINYKMTTGLEVDIPAWNKSRKGATQLQDYRDANPELTAMLDKIKHDLNETLHRETPISKDEMRKIIDDAIYADVRRKKKEEEDEAARIEAEKKRMTLRKFIDQFRKDIKSGARMTDKGTLYAPGTINAINQAFERLKKFEASKKHVYDFDEIDLNFYREYTAYLNKQGYAINTTGKCIKQLKAVMALAESDGFHNNAKYKDKRFKGARVEVDSIYLTKEDLAKMAAVDLSKCGYGFDLARDIFMVGVWTAQRVSDYNNIHKEDIESYQMRSIVDEPDPKHPGQTRARIVNQEVKVINIRQQKTGAKVAIPCSPDLIKILEKYNYDIPHLSDQNINDNIKEIARLAGLDEKIAITSTRGGKPMTEMIEKWKLVHSHTARRTGATLMYLSGMDIYDIMKITGHSTPVMLKKYIKADELEVVDKIMGKYDYFK